MLSGTVRSREAFSEKDFRRTAARFSATNLPQNLRLVDALEAVARQLDCTPSQVALAWLLAQGPDVVPIPGTRSIRHLEENVAALDVMLGAEQVARIEAAVPKESVAGER
jgi:aryl-alcohol dehydrogenase-like predicted oxidoreductase